MFSPIKIELKIKNLGNNYYGYKFNGNISDMCIYKLGTEMIDINEFSIKKINDTDCELLLDVSTDDKYTNFADGLFNIRIDGGAFYPLNYVRKNIYKCTISNSNLLEVFMNNIDKYLKISINFLFTRKMAKYVNRIQNIRFEDITVTNPELKYKSVIGFSINPYKFRDREKTLGFYDTNIFYDILLDWLELRELIFTQSDDGKYTLCVDIAKSSNILSMYREDSNPMEFDHIDLYVNNMYFNLPIHYLRSIEIPITEYDFNDVLNLSNPIYIVCKLARKVGM